MRVVRDIEIAAVVIVPGTYFADHWVRDMAMVMDTNGDEYCAYREAAGAFRVGEVISVEIESGVVPGGSWVHPH